MPHIPYLRIMTRLNKNKRNGYVIHLERGKHTVQVVTPQVLKFYHVEIIHRQFFYASHSLNSRLFHNYQIIVHFPISWYPSSRDHWNFVNASQNCARRVIPLWSCGRWNTVVIFGAVNAHCLGYCFKWEVEVCLGASNSQSSLIISQSCFFSCFKSSKPNASSFSRRIPYLCCILAPRPPPYSPR